jgi:hypothetical protein
MPGPFSAPSVTLPPVVSVCSRSISYPCDHSWLTERVRLRSEVPLRLSSSIVSTYASSYVRSVSVNSISTGCSKKNQRSWFFGHSTSEAGCLGLRMRRTRPPGSYVTV